MSEQIYVYLHDNPDAKKGKPNGSLPNAGELNHSKVQGLSIVDRLISLAGEMSASELKKLQRKQKKAQLKAQAKAQVEKGNRCQTKKWTNSSISYCYVCCVFSNLFPACGWCM